MSAKNPNPPSRAFVILKFVNGSELPFDTSRDTYAIHCCNAEGPGDVAYVTNTLITPKEQLAFANLLCAAPTMFTALEKLKLMSAAMDMQDMVNIAELAMRQAVPNVED